MRKRKRTVWVVMHYEIMGPADVPYIDSVQFHVSSSLKKAEAYVRATWVSAHSWWQVHPHVVDAADFDEGREVHYYSHRARQVQAAPTKRAFTEFSKHVARYPELYPTCPPTQE
jgi:hypothetical protein